MPRPLRVVLILVPILAGLAVGGWYVWTATRQPPPAAAGGEPPAPPPGPDTPTPPTPKPAAKLVVLVVFDQMRGDYLDRWAEAFGPEGFERMKAGGVWYANCHLPYACSSTGPGHASIVTGAPPSKHGIIENEWFDRPPGKAGSPVYCVQPLSRYELVPPIPATAGKPGRGDESGFSPERLLSPTVGDALLAATGGKSRVFSLSLKDRTAVLMGGKKPTGAYCFDTRDGRFHTGAYYRDAVHPWVEEANAAGGVNDWLGQEWHRFRSDVDYNRLAGPDLAPGEGFGVGQGRVFPHPMSDANRLGKTYYSAVETSPFGNEILLDLAKKAITAEKLGTGETPDLLCVSFSSNDLVGHQWGPDSHEVLDITLRSDQTIAELLRFLDETVGKDQYLVVITSDHGVCPIPEQERTKERYRAARRIPVADVLATLEDDLRSPWPDGPVRWLHPGVKPETVWPWVYLDRRAIDAAGKPVDAVCDFAAQRLGNQPGMLMAFSRRHIETNTLPPVTPGTEAEVRAVFDKVRLAYHPDRCGDVIVVPKPGVLVTAYPSGTSHGSPHSYDTHVPVLVYGAGVPARGRRTEAVSSLVVAPTLAWALGIDPPADAVEKVPAELGGR